VAVNPIPFERLEPRVPRGLARAVILAGGQGTRLRPYTSILPKPLMPIGDQSILEIVIGQLRKAGIVDVTLCVGYLSHLIRAVFDNRADQSVSVDYVQEEGARGTAGPLRLVDGLDETFIVMNGDVLTTIDYEDLLGYHKEHGNAVTIATHDRRIKIDYGVLQIDSVKTDVQIRGFEEKPEVVSTVSMGIYVIEPWVVDLIPKGRRFDFPTLIQRLLDAGERVGAYRHEGMWFDIGRHEDYEEAVLAWEAATQDSAAANGNGNGNGNVHANGNGHHTRRARPGTTRGRASIRTR
jgi:NDP-mannose synthase